MDNLPEEIKALYQERLWHELTEQLMQLQAHELHNAWPAICQFSDRLNQIKLVLLAQKVISVLDTAEATKFLEELQVVEKQAGVLLRTAVAHQLLRAGSLQQAEEILGLCQVEVENSTEVESVVYLQLYKGLARIHKEKGNPELFYRYSLQYLAYIAPEEVEDAGALAYELGVAVILAENIYNIGELIDQPVIKQLAGSEHD